MRSCVWKHFSGRRNDKADTSRYCFLTYRLLTACLYIWTFVGVPLRVLLSVPIAICHCTQINTPPLGSETEDNAVLVQEEPGLTEDMCYEIASFHTLRLSRL